MGLSKKFKSFFYKEKIDYTKGLVDPYAYHKSFYILCKVFRVLEDELLPGWTIITPILVGSAGSLATVICGMALLKYFTTFDVPLITESGTYFIVMFYKLLILSCSITNKPNYRNFLKEMKHDFEYICTTGSKYRTKFFENHLWTWKASIASSSLVTLLGGGIVLCAHLTLFFLLMFSSGNGRPSLPFPFWTFGLDYSKTPLYEISFIFFNLCASTHTITYIFMMQTQIVWIRQIISKADVIIWSIKDLLVDIHPTNDSQQNELYENVIKARMRHIIDMHHSMYRLLDDYAAVYKKLLMFEQKMCAPVTCLTAYVSAERLEAGEFPGVLMILCIAAISLNFIPSYMCTSLSEKVQSIGDACFETSFWNAPGKVIRPYFILIMQRSMRPLPIQTSGFDEVSLQTFSDKMKFAYSAFNMLRQVNYDK